jgi:single-strand DNA-binding protein
MADLNKVFLMGRLTFDPELRRTPMGTAVAELRLATSRTWTNRDGEPQKDTLYIDVTVWDRQAENCCERLRKGSAIHVEGYLKMDEWSDKTTGDKRSKIKVQAERVQFLDRRDESGSGMSEGDSALPAREASPRRGPASADSRGPSNGPVRGVSPQGRPAPSRPPVEPEGDDEDIPF